MPQDLDDWVESDGCDDPDPTWPALLALGLLASGLAVAAVPSAGASSARRAVEVYPVTPSGDFTLQGRGYGHGHGMSQWGAYGAASVRHLTGAQIVHFYYPHTELVARTGGPGRSGWTCRPPTQPAPGTSRSRRRRV